MSLEHFSQSVVVAGDRSWLVIDETHTFTTAEFQALIDANPALGRPIAVTTLHGQLTGTDDDGAAGVPARR